MVLSSKQRIINSLNGLETDRPCWCPFLAYWWEAQSVSFQKQGQLAFMESIGADPLLRGFYSPWKLIYDESTFRELRRRNERYEIWETPVGTLQAKYTYSPNGNTWFCSQHPVKEAEDLKILRWIYEHARIERENESDQIIHDIGERGYVMPLIGCESKTCFQSFVEKWVGTENLAYLTADDPDEVQDTLTIMQRLSQKTALLCAGMKYAESFIFWEDSSTTNISPAMFETFSSPEIRMWADILHAAGKKLIHHACGHVNALIEPMARNGIDAVESLTTPPTGNITMKEAWKKIPQNVAVISGIEPIFFSRCTLKELEFRIQELLSFAVGRRFILANADSCPPQVSLEKLRFVSAAVKKQGTG